MAINDPQDKTLVKPSAKAWAPVKMSSAVRQIGNREYLVRTTSSEGRVADPSISHSHPRTNDWY